MATATSPLPPDSEDFHTVTEAEVLNGTLCASIGHLYSGAQCVFCRRTCSEHTWENMNCTTCNLGMTLVTGIDGTVNSTAYAGDSADLPSLTTPVDATFGTIAWSVVSGPATVSGYTVSYTGVGTVVLKATVKNGCGMSKDYTETFTVTVNSKSEYDVSKIDGTYYDNALYIYEAGDQLAIRFGSGDSVKVPIGTQIVLKGSNTGSKYARVEVSGCANPVNLKLQNMTLSNTDSNADGVLIVGSGVTLNLALEGTNSLTTTYTESAQAIWVKSGATLNISGPGTLNATGRVGIGCSFYDASFGKVVIESGTVNATSNNDGAGIGTSYHGTGGEVIINGGTVTAKGGKYSAGIGGGQRAENINITINGGVVNAYGSDGYTLSNTGGAGIGSGYEGSFYGDSGGSVTINGGTVYAKGGVNSAGIGGGEGGTVDSITVTGGTVTAEGHWLGAGIGGGRLMTVDSIVITGGNIKASSGAANAVGSGGNTSDVTSVTDGKGNNVSLVTATLNGVSAKVAVTEVEGITYGLKDVTTHDTNKLYFYLPADTTATSITAGGVEYVCKDSSLIYYTGHDWSNNDGICVRCGEVCAHEGQTKTCTVCGKDLHEHDWTYEKVSDTKITATCTADGCDNPNGGYVTVSAPSSLTYTGSKIEAVVEDTLTTGAEVAVIYTGSTTDGYPVNAGEYTAKITLGEKEIGVTYTVEAIDIARATVSAGNAVYTGNPHRPAVTVELDGMTLTENTDYTVAYTDNTAVGTATVTVVGVGNYKGPAFGSFEIAYLTGAPDATVSGTKGENDWYTSAVTLTAPVGYTISKTADGTYYGESLTYADEQNETVTYYLKNDESGEIAQKTAPLKIDLNAPTAKYEIKGNGWREFVKFITFGIFCKDTADLTIEASDSRDDDVTVQYVISAEKLTASEITNWNDYTDKVALDPQAKNYIYIKVTDDAGHTVVYESGVVVFTDCVESTAIEYTKHGTEDVTAQIDFKGNTVKEVKYGSIVLTAEQYTVTDSGIQFKAAYLNTFAAGNYSFVVSYDPMGETWTESADGIENDAIGTTTVNLTVKKATLTIIGVALADKTYDGTKTGTVIRVPFKETDKLVLGTDYTATVVYDSASAGSRTATVTVTLLSTDKANAYALASTTYTVSDEPIFASDISDAFIFLGDALTYNGAEQTQTVSKVLTTDNLEVTFTVSGNKATNVGVYLLKVTGTGNFSGDATITYEIAPNTTAIDNLTVKNVKSSDKAAIEAVKAQIDNAVTDLADAETKAEYKAIADKCSELLARISKTLAENKRISDAVDGYDLATVTSDDKADLEQLLADIGKQLESTNLTDKEISELNGEKKAVEDLLAKISSTDELIDKLTGDVDGYSEDTVKSTDKDAIEQIIEDIDALTQTENLTEDEEKALEDAKTKAEGLLDAIENADGATNTESTEKVNDVTAENAKPEDKTDLENAKADLEKALEENAGNYTEEEKKAIQDKIDRVEDALTVIDNVEKAEEKIKNLPDTVTKDDIDVIDAAKKAYDELSDYEKSLVDSEIKSKLDAAVEAVEELNSPNILIVIAVLAGALVVIFLIIIIVKKKKKEEEK